MAKAAAWFEQETDSVPPKALRGSKQLYVADITSVPAWAGFLLFAGVITACARRIIGWAMTTHLHTWPIDPVGGSFDNALSESFFATLEGELIDRRTFRIHARRDARCVRVHRRSAQPAPAPLLG